MGMCVGVGGGVGVKLWLVLLGTNTPVIGNLETSSHLDRITVSVSVVFRVPVISWTLFFPHLPPLSSF